MILQESFVEGSSSLRGKKRGEHLASGLWNVHAKVAQIGQQQARQRKRLVQCSAGENALSISSNVLTRKSTEFLNPVTHAMALSNSSVVAANSSKLFDNCGESCLPVIQFADRAAEPECVLLDVNG